MAYTAKQRQQMAKAGQAMPDGSYPIANAADLQNAIHAVGRGGGSHDAIRRHIIRRANALGMSDAIPDNWNANGSMKAARLTDLESRAHQAVEFRGAAGSRTFELRDGDDRGPRFEGYASVVDTPYLVRDQLGTFTETVQAGAFTKSLSEKSKVLLLVNHGGIPLASTRSGTLELTEDPHLKVSSVLDGASPLVQEVRSAMTRGDLDQMSIGFRATRQEWNDDYSQRLVQEAELFDVSIVNNPASTATIASLRQQTEPAEIDTSGMATLANQLSSVVQAIREILGLGDWQAYTAEDATQEPVDEAADDDMREPDLARLAAYYDTLRSQLIAKRIA